jgi:general secretion pathway protein N
MSSLPTSLKKQTALAGLVSALVLTVAASQELSSSGVRPINPDIASNNMPTTRDMLADRPRLPSPNGRANPLWGISLSELAATRDRPIFSPTRRPRTIVSSSPLPPGLGPPLALIGSIAAESDSVAIFLDETTKDSIRLKPGQSHSGWTLQTIAGREATFQKENKNVILVLPNPSAPAR